MTRTFQADLPFVVSFGVAIIFGLCAAKANAETGFDAPIDLAVPIAPTSVQANGKTHLCYELRLTSFGQETLALAGIDVLPAEGEKSLGSFRGPSLKGVLQEIGKTEAVKPWNHLSAGASAVVFLWVTIDPGDQIPASLRHRVTFEKVEEGKGEAPGALTGPVVAVRKEPPMVIAPPLAGEGWLAANGPGNLSGHRRALIPIGGHAAIAQRFAIDWVRVLPEGGTHKGDAKQNASYAAYGAEALAVADGTVVEVKDGIPENVPGPASRAVPITLETVAGNHIVLDFGGGRYALYAHFQPGSLRVKAGDHVKRGQVLGLVGNSGNSTEPHLHFHICDAPSPLGSEGLPFVFESFELLGSGWSWKAEGDHPNGETRNNEIPMMNAVVRFPSRQ